MLIRDVEQYQYGMEEKLRQKDEKIRELQETIRKQGRTIERLKHKEDVNDGLY